MENNNLNVLKKFLKDTNSILKKYYIYIDDLSHERYFEYDSLYQIDVEARTILINFQDWCHVNQIELDSLWNTNLKLFAKMKPIVNDLYQNFLRIVFYDLTSVSLNSDNFEGYYYFLNLYKVFIILPYLLATYLIKNNKISLDKLSFELSNYLSLYEKYDLVIDRVKKYSELGQKKILFSNFTFETFFDVIDNLSNLSLLVTMGSKEAQKVAFKARVYNWKLITLLTTFFIVIMLIITIVVLKTI